MPILMIESGEACGMAAVPLLPFRVRYGVPAPAGLPAWPPLSAGDPDEENEDEDDDLEEDEDEDEDDEEEDEDEDESDEDEEFEEDEDEEG